ncbi:MAG: hypothetical protein R3C11_26695 [Planctomycetaceae bacterium]
MPRHRLTPPPSLLLAFMIGLLLCALPRQAEAFDLEEVRWGFDGSVVPNEINPIFFKIRNNTGEAEEFSLSLKRKSYNNQSVGAQISVAEEGNRLFLSPYSERWVTFYIYCTYNSQEVQLYTEKGRFGAAIPAPPRTNSTEEEEFELSRVLIATEDRFNLDRGALIKRFPEELFPPIVTGTDSLGAVFLDHVPRWQPEQRKTFMRWINRGGVLHLLQSRSGNFPQFEGELAVLNAPLDSQYVGSGLVIRHPRTADSLNKTALEDIQKQQDKFFGYEAPKNNNENQDNYSYGYYGNTIHDTFFPNLKEYVNPNHNWAIIYFLSFLYLLVIFPGAWLVMKKRNDFRFTYGVLILSTCFFGLMFNMVGARGYGESTQINSIAVARVLPEDEVDVTQFSNAFVTSGDQYLLNHQGTGVIYSTANDNDDVLGTIQLGPQAAMYVDIPPFSSRPFMHRTLIPHKAPAVEVVDFKNKSDLKDIKLKIEGVSSRTPVWAVYGDKISNLSLEGEFWTTSKKGQGIQEFMQNLAEDYQYNYYRSSHPNGVDTKGLDTTLFRLVIRRGLHIRTDYRGIQTKFKRDRLYLFIQAELPEELYCSNTSFQQQSGQLVYQYELILSE